jgi:hypothetical protein
MQAGVNPAAVQRILRHGDPKITTEVYGHLAPGYLRAEMNRLAFGWTAPEVSDQAQARAAAGAEPAPFAASLLQEGEGRKSNGREPSHPR